MIHSGPGFTPIRRFYSQPQQTVRPSATVVKTPTLDAAAFGEVQRLVPDMLRQAQFPTSGQVAGMFVAATFRASSMTVAQEAAILVAPKGLGVGRVFHTLKESPTESGTFTAWFAVDPRIATLPKGSTPEQIAAHLIADDLRKQDTVVHPDLTPSMQRDSLAFRLITAPVAERYLLLRSAPGILSGLNLDAVATLVSQQFPSSMSPGTAEFLPRTVGNGPERYDVSYFKFDSTVSARLAGRLLREGK